MNTYNTLQRLSFFIILIFFCSCNTEKKDWENAFTSHDSSSIKSCIEKYPTSNNTAKGQELLWEMRWTPVKYEKANSIVIYSKNMEIISGLKSYAINNFSHAIPVPPTVIIWRDSPNYPKENKSRFRPSYAFLQNEKGEFHLIRKVDLTKSDDGLRKEFGF